MLTQIFSAMTTLTHIPVNPGAAVRTAPKSILLLSPGGNAHLLNPAYLFDYSPMVNGAIAGFKFLQAFTGYILTLIAVTQAFSVQAC
jgi:hypothetical protein